MKPALSKQGPEHCGGGGHEEGHERAHKREQETEHNEEQSPEREEVHEEEHETKQNTINAFPLTDSNLPFVPNPAVCNAKENPIGDQISELVSNRRAISLLNENHLSLKHVKASLQSSSRSRRRFFLKMIEISEVGGEGE